MQGKKPNWISCCSRLTRSSTSNPHHLRFLPLMWIQNISVSLRSTCHLDHPTPVGHPYQNLRLSIRTGSWMMSSNSQILSCQDIVLLEVLPVSAYQRLTTTLRRQRVNQQRWLFAWSTSSSPRMFSCGQPCMERKTSPLLMLTSSLQ